MYLAFTDTFYWIALINPGNAVHHRVAAFDIAANRPDLVTSEETLVEFLTFFSGRGPISRARAVAVARGVAGNKSIRVIPQTIGATCRAWNSMPPLGYEGIACRSAIKTQLFSV